MNINRLHRRVIVQTAAVVALMYTVYGLFCLGIAKFSGRSVGMAALYAFWLPAAFLFLMHFVHSAVMSLGIRWVGDSVLPAGNRIFLRTCCLKYKIASLRVGVVGLRIPNAFVFGTRWNPRIVFTAGIIESLTEDELNAVIAHELGHLRHDDVIFLGIAALIYVLLKRSGQRMAFRSFYGAFLVALFLRGCASVARLIYLKLSRTREFYADAFSAIETGKPDALASALLKIQFGSSASRLRLFKDIESSDRRLSRQARKEFSALEPISAFTISSLSSDLEMAPQPHGLHVLKRELTNPWANLRETVSTHPSTARRINKLGEMASEMGLPFRHTIPVEKGADRLQFATELLCYCAPWLAIGLAFPVAPTWFYPLLVICGCLLRTWFRYRGRATDVMATSLAGRLDTNEMMSVRVRLEGELRAKPPFDAPVLVDRSGFVPIYVSPYSYTSRRRLKTFVGRSVVIQGWYRSNGVPYIEAQRIEETGHDMAIRAYTREVKAVLAVVIVPIISRLLIASVQR